MTVLLKANTELVAIAWLKGVIGLDPNAIGTIVPSDTNAWLSTGFVQVQGIGGAAGNGGGGGGGQGAPMRYVPVANPVVQINTWANNGTSKKPPWGKANNLIELVRAGTYAENCIREVVLPGDYPAVRVISAYLIIEPRRLPSDPASFARYASDLQMHWVEVS